MCTGPRFTSSRKLDFHRTANAQANAGCRHSCPCCRIGSGRSPWFDCSPHRPAASCPGSSQRCRRKWPAGCQDAPRSPGAPTPQARRSLDVAGVEPTIRLAGEGAATHERAIHGHHYRLENPEQIPVHQAAPAHIGHGGKGVPKPAAALVTAHAHALQGCKQPGSSRPPATLRSGSRRPGTPELGLAEVTIEDDGRWSRWVGCPDRTGHFRLPGASTRRLRTLSLPLAGYRHQ